MMALGKSSASTVDKTGDTGQRQCHGRIADEDCLLLIVSSI
jgi:hypothetical protein